MELVGKLKDQVENSSNKEEAKKLIEKAGMKLSDEELSQVSGGRGYTAEEEREMAEIKVKNLLKQFKESKDDKERKSIWTEIYELCRSFGFPLPTVN